MKLLFIFIIVALVPFCCPAQNGNINILRQHDTSAYNVAQWTQGVLGKIALLKKKYLDSAGRPAKASFHFFVVRQE